MTSRECEAKAFVSADEWMTAPVPVLARADYHRALRDHMRHDDAGQPGFGFLPRGVAVIRVLLVEDMCLVRGALVALLDHEADIEVVGEVGWGGQVVPLAVKLQAHVMVINTDPIMNRLFPTLDHLQATARRCAVLILADPRQPALLPWGSRTRSLSFLVKDAQPELLADAIRRVAEGERLLDPQIAVSALVGAENALTRREMEVLEFAAGGASAPEIADQLHLAVGTVRNHLSAVIAKTGARNRIDAIRIARDAGWLSLRPEPGAGDVHYTAAAQRGVVGANGRTLETAADHLRPSRRDRLW
jgi:two-component system response regulator DesR